MCWLVTIGAYTTYRLGYVSRDHSNPWYGNPINQWASWIYIEVALMATCEDLLWLNYCKWSFNHIFNSGLTLARCCCFRLEENCEVLKHDGLQVLLDTANRNNSNRVLWWVHRGWFTVGWTIIHKQVFAGHQPFSAAIGDFKCQRILNKSGLDLGITCWPTNRLRMIGSLNSIRWLMQSLVSWWSIANTVNMFPFPLRSKRGG